MLTPGLLEREIWQALKGEGLPDNVCNLVTAQSKHESGNYTSRVFLKNNNCFGYKFVGQRWATQGLKSPEGDFYAHYDSPADSAREIARWIKRRQNSGLFPRDLDTITGPEEYAHLLKACGYFGDSVENYTKGLKHHFKTLKY